MHTKPRTVDPAVAKARSDKANAVKAGDTEKADQATRELDRAKRLAALKAAAKNSPPLEPILRDSIIGQLYAAGDAA